jgi:hypothetical protein
MSKKETKVVHIFSHGAHALAPPFFACDGGRGAVFLTTILATTSSGRCSPVGVDKYPFTGSSSSCAKIVIFKSWNF